MSIFTKTDFPQGYGKIRQKGKAFEGSEIKKCPMPGNGSDFVLDSSYNIIYADLIEIRQLYQKIDGDGADGGEDRKADKKISAFKLFFGFGLSLMSISNKNLKI